MPETPSCADDREGIAGRRAKPRYLLQGGIAEIAVSYAGGDSDDAVCGRLTGISELGVTLETSKPLRGGLRMDFKIQIPDAGIALSGKGRVVWCRAGHPYLAGLRFFRFDNETHYQDYIHFINDRSSIFQRNDRRKTCQASSPKFERRLSKPIFHKCRINSPVDDFLRNDHYYFLREIQSGSKSRVLRNNRELLNFGSNNYLDLASHPLVIAAAVEATRKYGVGSGGARQTTGTTDLHNQLEKRLAQFMDTEDCVLYPAGYSTNIGVISALVQRDELIFIDERSHASIYDGCHLSGAQMQVFSHNDMDDLERRLKKFSKDQPKIIVTEGVFSMDGDICPLPTLYGLGNTYGAAVMIDDAHSTGVLGETGRGTCEHVGLEGKLDLVIGTLSKGLGGIGGFAAATKKIVDYLKHNSRSFIFSTSLPPSVCAAVLRSIDVIVTEPQWHRGLWENIGFARDSLTALGFDTGRSQSAIIPVILRDTDLTLKFAGALENLGILVSPVLFPAVRITESRLRVSIMATHTREDLARLVSAMQQLGERFGVI